MMMMRLKGQSILVVEHEPSVARELEQEFTQAGAKVFAAGRLRDALYLAEYPALSAAVVNVQMGRAGESTAAVCHRLQEVRLDRGGQHVASGSCRRQARSERGSRRSRRRPAAARVPGAGPSTIAVAAAPS
jgi:CheY-like chemotaxis protein